MELFTDKESTIMEDTWLTPDSGMPLLEVDYLYFDMIKPNLLAIEYLDKDGKGGQVFVNLRSEGGGDI
jgi:hypothetical protein